MTVYRLLLTFYITIHTWLYLVLSLSHYILRSGQVIMCICVSTCSSFSCARSLNLCHPPYLGFGLHALVVRYIFKTVFLTCLFGFVLGLALNLRDLAHANHRGKESNVIQYIALIQGLQLNSRILTTVLLSFECTKICISITLNTILHRLEVT